MNTILIKQALVQADGSVVHAAKLIGRTYQGLTWLIANKYPDLLKSGHRSDADHAGRKRVDHDHHPSSHLIVAC